MKIETAADQLEALGNPTRLRVYRILVRAGREGLPVGRLQSRLAIAASTLSHHLRRLIEAGLVTQERQATTLISTASGSTAAKLAILRRCASTAAYWARRAWRSSCSPR